MKLTVQINVAAAIRRGINAPGTVVTIDIDPAVLTQSQRDWFAEHIRIADSYAVRDHAPHVRFGDLTLLSPALERPDEQGIAEAADAALAKATVARAAASAEIERAVAEIVPRIIRDISTVSICDYGVEIFATTEDATTGSSKRQSYHQNAGYASLPEEIRAMWDAEKARRAAIHAERQAEIEARKAAIEARIVAAVEAALTPTQRQMRERGLLSISAVRKKILADDAESVAATVAGKLGDGYDVEVAGWAEWKAKTSPNQKQFRQLARIEQVLGLSPDDTYIAELGGGRITVHARVRTALDLPACVAITYPASID